MMGINITLTKLAASSDYIIIRKCNCKSIEWKSPQSIFNISYTIFIMKSENLLPGFINMKYKQYNSLSIFLSLSQRINHFVISKFELVFDPNAEFIKIVHRICKPMQKYCVQCRTESYRTKSCIGMNFADSAFTIATAFQHIFVRCSLFI